MNVERVTVFKFLGVQVHEKLKWDAQINAVCKNISKGISILYEVKHILDTKILVKYGVILAKQN